MGWSLKRWLIGRPLKSAELGEQKLIKTKALAILSSDALSSVAYGPEQILLTFAAVGPAAFWFSVPIGVGVLVLLTALILSYRQIIFAYPHGGGAYVVSKENLGLYPGLVAGGSLLVDYILTVAVSVSAGTDAVTSAFPVLHAYSVPIAVAFVVFITVLNLRGVTESASILAYPVYLFVAALFVLIVAGLVREFSGVALPEPQTPIGTPVAGVGLFLLLRAFASGSSALTGVEAISNAIPNFKAPATNNAAKTLLAMGLLLAVLFAGIVYFVYDFGVVPDPEVTVLSQLAETTFGRGWMYYFIQATTALILILAANTGYSAFPLLAVNLANDRFIPRMFTVRGDRLGYSNGILFLGLLSILLIIAFQGQTEHLIPLYAVGVFIPFTLSQTGMIVKWIREKPRGWQGKLAVNAVGAFICLTVTGIFFVTKFGRVWPVLVFLPLLIYGFHRIRKHYNAVGEQLRVVPGEPALRIEGNVVILPVGGITRVVENSVNYARTLHADQIIAVHVPFERGEEERFERKWREWMPEIRLVTLYSPYRSILQPLSKFIDTVSRKAEESNYTVTVVIPQFFPRKGWHHFLHNQTSLLLRTRLLYRQDVVVTTVPYHLKK
ncbi:APC family permease [Cohnella caldifontis]|uniref:APC family permease n=1 Tax=Cohnella caldifontis TaxID=3027471 RepID=UPI0023EBA03D|nr:APC family permease [Cohnella sp. YIM B05605]